MTLSGGLTTWANGSTLNTNGYSVTVASFGTVAASTRYFNFGSSTITVTLSGTVWNIGSATITSSPGAVISFTKASGNIIIFSGSGYCPALQFSGSGTVTINPSSGGTTFQNISSSYVGTKTFKFLAGSTSSFIAFNLRGTAGNLYTITSSSNSATTLKKVGTWYMGANSTDSGNNTNLTFSGNSGVDYLDVSYITGVSVDPGSSWFFLR